jgi:D-glycero-D-manno-heptose 1,7-bisphosphate phosphatase
MAIRASKLQLKRTMKKAIFIDKDGTLIHDIPYNVDASLVQFIPGALEGLTELKKQGYMIILVSNQSGVARGYFTENALESLITKMQEMMRLSEIEIDAFYFCPHHPDGVVHKYAISCDCRKPKPGMLLQAADKYNIDLSQSWMIGDILNDVEAGNAAGCRTILIDNGNETEWVLSERRKPTATVRDLRQAAEAIIHQFEPYEKRSAISQAH